MINRHYQYRGSATSTASLRQSGVSLRSSVSSRTSAGVFSSPRYSAQSPETSKTSTQRSSAEIQSHVSTPAGRPDFLPSSNSPDLQHLWECDLSTQQDPTSMPSTTRLPDSSDVRFYCTSPYCKVQRVDEGFERREGWIAHETEFHEKDEEYKCCGKTYGKKARFQEHHKRKHEECFKAQCLKNPRHPQGKCTCCTHVDDFAQALPTKCAWGCPYCLQCSPTWKAHHTHIAECHYNSKIAAETKTRAEISKTTLISSLLKQRFTSNAWTTLTDKRDCRSISWDQMEEQAFLHLKSCLELSSHHRISPSRLATQTFDASNLGGSEEPEMDIVKKTGLAAHPSPSKQPEFYQQRDPYVKEQSMSSIQHRHRTEQPLHVSQDLRYAQGQPMVSGPLQSYYSEQPISHIQQFSTTGQQISLTPHAPGVGNFTPDSNNPSCLEQYLLNQDFISNDNQYVPGQQHPPHGDPYVSDQQHLGCSEHQQSNLQPFPYGDNLIDCQSGAQESTLSNSTDDVDEPHLVPAESSTFHDPNARKLGPAHLRKTKSMPKLKEPRTKVTDMFRKKKRHDGDHNRAERSFF